MCGGGWWISLCHVSGGFLRGPRPHRRIEGLHTSKVVAPHGRAIVVLAAAVRWSCIVLLGAVVASLGRSRSGSSLVVRVGAPTVSRGECEVSGVTEDIFGWLWILWGAD